MTIKLPEPDGYITVEEVEDCGHSIEHTIKKLPCYTAATVNRLIRDALDEAAGLIAERATKHSKLAMAVYSLEDEYVLKAFVLAEETVRKLKEQLK